MKLHLYEFDLPLRHVFTISRGSVAVQKTLIVDLEHDGLHGYGEATTNPYYGATIENMVAALLGVQAEIEQWSPGDPQKLWDALDPVLGRQPFAQCALDQAAHDLWGKAAGVPVYRLWGLAAERLPASNYTIGIDTLERMIAKLDEAPGWPIYKIKLGTPHDLEIVRQLRQRTDAVFRVDANCGWTVDETLHNARVLRDLNVEFIEQPLPAEADEDMRRVAAECVLPVMADESCGVAADIDRCHNCFDGVNIKLVKCGGLTPARRMIVRARLLDLKVMVGCMTESSVGISAIAQLLPQLDYVDMDGAVLLAQDIASGATVRQGVCHYPEEHGCGVRLTAEPLRVWA